MPDAFPWTPSTLPEGSYVYAVCKACKEVRYITRAMVLARAGDVPFRSIETRLRCVARPGGKRAPACGGRMALELASAGHGETEAKGGWPTLPARPQVPEKIFRERQMAGRGARAFFPPPGHPAVSPHFPLIGREAAPLRPGRQAT